MPPRRKRPKKKGPSTLLILGLAGGAFVIVAIVAVVLIVVTTGNTGKALGLGGLVQERDPKFDQVQEGMTEQEVLALLGDQSFQYQPGAVGIWTYPRRTFDEHQREPHRNKEIEDVIFVYFRDGKVDNIYRVTGEEFRRPRPRSR
jgi:hypothetical protein